ncbi:hypothetical protein HY333_00915, partial [Candidatus Collierbacteria bacterium]|nr:hypothetical protein [Candidatus Collierbacteria bacterium]
MKPKKVRRQLQYFFTLLLRHYRLILLLLTITTLVLAGLTLKNFLARRGIFTRDIASFFQQPSQNLALTNDRTNFLILGIRGSGPDSPDLTDSLLLLSVSYPNQSISLLSIPRDLWV